MKASWGTSTLPMAFMRFLPAFCCSSSLRFQRECRRRRAWPETSLRFARTVWRDQDPPADRRLDRNLEHLLRDRSPRASRAGAAAAVVRLVLMDDEGEFGDRLARKQDIKLLQRARLIAQILVIEAGVAFRAAFELVEVIRS